jgi:hypothetical protein
MEQRRQKRTPVETSATTDRQGQPHPRGEQEARRDRSRHERRHHSETLPRRQLARGQTARTMPHMKKKPPSGMQPRRRHARGQTTCRGAQSTHRRKSAEVQSSSTTSCREAKNENFDDTSKEEDDTGCDTVAAPELSPSRDFAQFPIHPPNNI